MNLQQYQKSLEEIFQSNNVVLAYLFGSYATKKANTLSDIDIAVLCAEKVDTMLYTEIQIELITTCIKLFKKNEVDVVVLNAAAPLLAFQVVKNGAVLYDPQGRHLNFRIKTLNTYYDTEYLRNVQTYYLKQWIKQQKSKWKEPAGKW